MTFRRTVFFSTFLLMLHVFTSHHVWGTQQDPLIHTIAGGNVGDGRLASEVPLNRPKDVVVDAAGDLYVVEEFNDRVRRIDAETGAITTVAGNGVSGFGGDGGPAVSAMLSSPQAIALDPDGNLYIADFQNHRIRRVEAQTGIITTVAGDGQPGFGGDDGPATEASLREPIAVALDSVGDLYISDSGNNRIRKVEAATGTIRSIAGSGRKESNGDGRPASEASLNPAGLAFDAQDNLYVADRNFHRIRRIDRSTGIISTVAGDGFVVTCALDNPITCVPGIAGNGRFNVESGPARRVSLNFPQDITIDAQGYIYIADTNNHRVRRLDPVEGLLETVAGSSRIDPVTGLSNGGSQGDGGPATEAEFDFPTGVAVSSAGTLFIADSVNNSLRTVKSNIIATHAGAIISFGDGGPATEAGLHSPAVVTFDADGNLFIAEPATGRIRRVDALTGIITTVAGTGTIGLSDDGGPATEASLGGPVGLAVDSAGNLYISELVGQRVRKVDHETGVITTVAGNGTPGFGGDDGPAPDAQLNGPIGIDVGPNDILYIADACNHRIRAVDLTTGIITTVAGNGALADPETEELCSEGIFAGDRRQARDASLNFPEDVALDPDGSLIIADSLNFRIRRVDASTGRIETIAGDGRQGDRGDNGPAGRARFIRPRVVDADEAGNIYIVDQRINRVRRIDGRSRRIFTVAGNGEPGFSGDGGLATEATLRGPLGLAAQADGSFVFCDVGNNRVRRVQ